ncbi:PREDICTED: feruloyl CoA ortho-hydroxylase 1-like [Nicotiana attenuata]|uniref:feruloyl-CoA 6-hydroxylase n=1 Tax=Nicotiana attenuata TaxID=49451 RepID=A0A1J6ITK3_NICAT|nr:PREDICTED: feruloyl CoA ortho-hydroxylase 1-like [Nicotiana attenuata]OIS98480.1 feruloyl coa ortho-hydroxylase 1 [Nicotiana attenuata]
MVAHLSKILSNSKNVFDFVVNEGNGVKGLSDMGIQSLPVQYIQPLEERITTSTVITDDSIPIIDASNWNDPKVADQICMAAQNWGFFQIINHGVPIEVLDNIKETSHRFFSLPAEEKKMYSKENSISSNVRYGTSFTPEAEKTLGWRDYLSLVHVSDDEAAEFWPPSCREEALEYLKRCDTVIRKILKVLMGGLNVKTIDEEKEDLLIGSKRINFNYYPKCPNPELSVGVARHSDISTITFLLQDDIGGLYVKKLDSNAWIHVPPINGALVINIGDALQIMSNDKYKSVEHRVIANGSKNRVSVPIFLHPKPSSVIGPLQEVLKNGEKPIYKQILYADYTKIFFSKGHDGKDTIECAKI